MDKATLWIEVFKLESFIKHNQLVQAKALTDRLISHTQSIIANDCNGDANKAEQHPFWLCFRALHRVNQCILKGEQELALGEIMEITRKIKE